MKEDIQQISFNNQRSKNHFDLIELRELLDRKNLPHALFEFQQIDFYMLFICTKGKGTHTIDFTDYSYQKGSVLSIRKDQIHKFHPNSNSQGFLLLFTDDFLIHFFEKKEILKSLQLFNELISNPKSTLEPTTFTTLLLLIKQIQQENFSINDLYSTDIVRCQLQIIIRLLLRNKSLQKQHQEHHKYLSPFLTFQKLVEQECFQTKKVNFYASKMAISSKTLNNITQAILHKSAKQFIDEIAVTQIKRLLVNTKLSVKEIAYRSGFEDPSNLYKFFKKHTQTTPEHFRTTFT